MDALGKNRKLLSSTAISRKIKDLTSDCLVKTAFLATFIWGIVAHAYGFFSGSLSHDGLNAFVATVTEECWKVELGRWAVPIYRSLTRGHTSLPWLIGLLGILFTAAAVCIVLRLLNVRSKIQAVLISGIMVTNITYISQIATYLYEFDFNALALLLAVSAVAFWRQGSVLSLGLSCLCICLSAGIYQAYIVVVPTLVVFICVLDLLDGRSEKRTLANAALAALSFLAGFGLYIAVSKAACRFAGVEMQDRTDVVSALGRSSGLLGRMASIPSHLMKSLAHPAYSISWMQYIIPAVFAAVVVCVAVTLAKMRCGALRSVMVVLGLLAIPILMDSLYVAAIHVHDLMTYPLWLSYVFAAVLCGRLCHKDKLSRTLNKFTMASVFALMVIVLWQNILIANTAYLKKEREAEATLSIMTRVVYMLEQQQGYVIGETPLTFVGVANDSTPSIAYGNIDKITGLSGHSSIPLDTQTYYYNAYKSYFDYVLDYPAVFCLDDVHESLKSSETVREMPAFPERGCMQFVDDILVIKMG